MTSPPPGLFTYVPVLNYFPKTCLTEVVVSACDDGPPLPPPPPTALPESITAQLRTFRLRQEEQMQALEAKNTAEKSGDSTRILDATERWQRACVRSDTEAIWLGWACERWLPKEAGR